MVYGQTAYNRIVTASPPSAARITKKNSWASLKADNASAFLPMLAVFHMGWFVELLWSHGSLPCLPRWELPREPVVNQHDLRVYAACHADEEDLCVEV